MSSLSKKLGIPRRIKRNTITNNKAIFRPAIRNIQQIVIYWFRNNDLRVTDNQGLEYASQLAYNNDCHIIPVYVFDKQLYGNNNRTQHTNSLRCGIRRTKFIIESVMDVRNRLQQYCATSLLVGYDTPANFFRMLFTDLKQYYTKRYHIKKFEKQRYKQQHQQRQQQQQQSASTTNEPNDDITDNQNVKNKEGTDDDDDDELLFDIHLVCQDEPLRDERMQLYHVTNVLQHYNDVIIDPNNFKYQRKNHETKYYKTITTIWGSTLYLLKHLKTIDHTSTQKHMEMPDLFSTFNHKIQNDKIQDPIPHPTYMSFPIGLYPSASTVDTTTTTTTSESDHLTVRTTASTSTTNRSNPLTFLPTLQDLGYTNEQIDMISKDHLLSKVRNIIGGETMAYHRMKEYIWEKDRLKYWAKMRSLPIVENKSTLFSPYLSHGCISPRMINVELKLYYKDRHKAHDAMIMTQQELRMRDYIKMYCKKHGDGIFYKHGPVPRNKRDTKPKLFLCNDTDFTIWKEGRTGYPFVDATMREIAATGYAAYRCRLNAASFLIYDMKHDWRRGAEYYEEQFIDYDVYLNWWAWCDIAGLTTGRTFPRCVIAFEGNRFDPDGFYVKQWVPELRNVPKDYIHEPWKLTSEQQIQYKVQLGVDYPQPIVDPFIGEERRKERAAKRDEIRKLKFIAVRTGIIPKKLKRFKSWQLDKIREAANKES